MWLKSQKLVLVFRLSVLEITLELTLSYRSGGGGGGGRAGGSGGKPFGEGGDRDRWVALATLGAIGLIGVAAYYQMGFREITWKEFSKG